LECPIHHEPLFDNGYDKRVGYCKRCRTWYQFDEEKEEEK